ncbi:MAG: hypothetical protein HC880_19335, partial [Bacteroidia bacterium]|nr:hypothetical protein [Bacteroidia bacterium]
MFLAAIGTSGAIAALLAQQPIRQAFTALSLNVSKIIRKGDLIELEGVYGQGRLLRYEPAAKTWVPTESEGGLRPAEDAAQRNWDAMMADFIADIRGEPHQTYLTFHDGWFYQHVI